MRTVIRPCNDVNSSENEAQHESRAHFLFLQSFII